jgi:hypothetical protein
VSKEKKGFLKRRGSPFLYKNLFRFVVDLLGDFLGLFRCHIYVMYLLGMGRGDLQDFLDSFGMDNGITIKANITTA